MQHTIMLYCVLTLTPRGWSSNSTAAILPVTKKSGLGRGFLEVHYNGREDCAVHMEVHTKLMVLLQTLIILMCTQGDPAQCGSKGLHSWARLTSAFWPGKRMRLKDPTLCDLLTV